MSAPVDKLLERLAGVKQTRRDRWIANCPAHEDKHPSLSVGIGNNDSVILKCWSGCGAADVLAAVGLEFSDLYPERIPEGHRSGPLRKPWPAGDVLRCVANEALIASSICSEMADMHPGKRDRLVRAASRLMRAATGAGVMP